MNDYKITCSNGDVTITAVDEKDARRIFRETHTKKEADCDYAAQQSTPSAPPL